MSELEKNISLSSFDTSKSFDIIIISTRNTKRELYWEKALEERKKSLINPLTKIAVVSEDWEGGAGNGLGTLYAFKKAQTKLSTNLFDELEKGKSIAIYHTPGLGKRMYPIAASEEGNKTAIKLPIIIDNKPLSILEAVIRQTAIFSESLKGRLSVFWGDQLFLPSTNVSFTPTHHLEIFAKVYPKITKKIWDENKLSKYGLIALDKNKNGILLEKTNYHFFKQLIDKKVISIEGGVGISLGSFSMSKELLEKLFSSFYPSLTKKDEKLDSDPHFWMPLTLDKNTYLNIIDNKKLYEKIQQIKSTIKEPLVTVRNIGVDSYWWDYGELICFYKNMLKILDNNDEGRLLRRIFKLETAYDPTSQSICVNSQIKRKNIHKSLIFNTVSNEVNLTHSLAFFSLAKKIQGDRCVLYKITNQDLIKMNPCEVKTEFFCKTSEKPLILTSLLSRDSKKDWETPLPNNPYTYSEIHKKFFRS